MRPEQLVKADTIDKAMDCRKICTSILKILKHRQILRRNRIHSLNKKKYEITVAYNKLIRAIDREIISTQNSYPTKGAGKIDIGDRHPADL
tara:strand:- start:74 stop:346 length:273 start_codon:yes stop_codon:yes gene_type:complete